VEEVLLHTEDLNDLGTIGQGLQQEGGGGGAGIEVLSSPGSPLGNAYPPARGMVVMISLRAFVR